MRSAVQFRPTLQNEDDCIFCAIVFFFAPVKLGIRIVMLEAMKKSLVKQLYMQRGLKMQEAHKKSRSQFNGKRLISSTDGYYPICILNIGFALRLLNNI